MTHFTGKQFLDIVNKVDIELQKNYGVFQDSLLQLFQPSEQSFYQLFKGRESTILSNSEGEFMTIYLRTDEMYQFYDRKVYSIGDLVGQIGGFFEIIKSLGALMTFFIAQRLFSATLANNLYQIRCEDQEFS
jgi:uncharacterized protein YbcI